MPRGRKKVIVEETELPIIDTDDEAGNIPFFLIDEEFGISCDQYGYMLCRKKRANRTIKNEEGNDDHIETYWMWTAYKYTSTFESIMNCYVKQKERDLNKKLIKEKDFKAILEHYKQIHQIIKNALSVEGLNKDFISMSSLIDQRKKLEDEIKDVETYKNSLKQKCDELQEAIKEARKIVVEKHKPKK